MSVDKLWRSIYTYSITGGDTLSKMLSIKMDETIFKETEMLVKKTKVNRNAYINKAVHFYNRFQKRHLLGEQMRKASLLVRENSMEVLRDFDSTMNDGLEDL